ncbi:MULTISPECIES: NUDIX hydrolase [Halorubrum]|jgi:ADP-ribose pyrophosphatase|uniref:NUDIX hydrolase n=1 Tax=Halorubrum tropicale TaxID=1765655 RepID=A0A0N0BS70_9EURY|nr:MULTISPECIES: NUDIX hydrolase [Halorubrum]KOX97804.1 NUDIX hydrolase [Halorubrum tropicale]TKX43077.1 NUDIX hydrolase [Halorubrum sp. ARQ200]TKX50578.1 NUDIX hydrolase [Halorubrum sp. ASP121]TKX62232.1 NUDIX hydrolase [Halorubrum sp. ASP1]
MDDPDDLAWETLGSAVDYTCPGFDVRRDEVRFPDGETDGFHYVDEPPAVVVLPLTPDGDAVVIDEWRQAVGRVNRGIPAGTMEPEDGDGGADGGVTDEAVERAAARELAEETGYEADSFERLTTVEPTNGMANAVHHHVLATGCEPTADRDLDHNESISVETVPYDDLLAAVVDDGLRDGRAVTAVLWYELLRR